MKIYNRKALFSELKDYCSFAKGEDFCEVTEWNNGEGFDVTIDSNPSANFSLTYEQWDLLKKMIKKLTKKEFINND